MLKKLNFLLHDQPHYLKWETILILLLRSSRSIKKVIVKVSSKNLKLTQRFPTYNKTIGYFSTKIISVCIKVPQLDKVILLVGGWVGDWLAGFN